MRSEVLLLTIFAASPVYGAPSSCASECQAHVLSTCGDLSQQQCICSQNGQIFTSCLSQYCLYDSTTAWRLYQSLCPHQYPPSSSQYYQNDGPARANYVPSGYYWRGGYGANNNRYHENSYQDDGFASNSNQNEASVNTPSKSAVDEPSVAGLANNAIVTRSVDDEPQATRTADKEAVAATGNNIAMYAANSSSGTVIDASGSSTSGGFALVSTPKPGAINFGGNKGNQTTADPPAAASENLGINGTMSETGSLLPTPSVANSTATANGKKSRATGPPHANSTAPQRTNGDSINKVAKSGDRTALKGSGSSPTDGGKGKDSNGASGARKAAKASESASTNEDATSFATVQATALWTVFAALIGVVMVAC